MAAPLADLTPWTAISSYAATFIAALTFFQSWMKEGGRKRSRRIQVVEEAAKALSLIKLRIEVRQLSADEDQLKIIKRDADEDAIKITRWTEDQLVFSGSPLDADQKWGDAVKRGILAETLLNRLTLRLPLKNDVDESYLMFKSLRQRYYLFSVLVPLNLMPAISIILSARTTHSLFLFVTGLVLVGFEAALFSMVRHLYGIAIQVYIRETLISSAQDQLKRSAL